MLFISANNLIIGWRVLQAVIHCSSLVEISNVRGMESELHIACDRKMCVICKYKFKFDTFLPLDHLLVRRFHSSSDP